MDAHVDRPAYRGPRCALGRNTPAAAVLIGCVISLVGGLGLLSAESASAKKRPTYCTRHHHPRGCIHVPRAAKRPKRLGQQGPGALTPTDVENGGGLGGGPGDHRDGALQWARSQTGLKLWAWRCERFVEEAYGTRGRFPTAAAASRSLRLHRGNARTAPAGSLLYFAPDKYNQDWGHVGISLGHGRMISALATVAVTNILRSRYWRSSYLGWADAPADWPGRIPPPPGPRAADPSIAVRITAPAPGSPQSGIVPLLAAASGASGVAFDAYYATDPKDPSSRRWQPLGTAAEHGDSWELDWDTSAIPDQGRPDWGTVNIAAVALDADGKRTGTRDFRRISIINAVASLPVTPPGASSPPAAAPVAVTPATYPETAGGVAHTWSDYGTAGGTAGPNIAGQQTVEISCKVSGFRVADGNTWWYRIAESPWNNQFYVSADAFYNNGQTSGSLQGTPFVDPAVPDCS